MIAMGETEPSSAQSSARNAGTVTSGLGGIPFKNDEDSSAAPLNGWALLVLLSVIALALFLHRRVRRSQGVSKVSPSQASQTVKIWPIWSWAGRLEQKSKAITVVASRSLNAQGSVHVVEWQGKQLLLGCTAGGISVLGEAGVAGSTHVEQREAV